MSNDLSKDLSQKGTGKMACIAAIGAGGPMAINSARNAKILLVIDGCPMACAKKILERSGLNATIHVLITDIGMKKTDALSYSEDEMRKAFIMTMEKLRHYLP